ncbi:hypothetical protein [Ructibacterium gallinarum]|uniref:Uncharacterized protein n=1 Tax=Ructibacterium gallinarum TaxID=2779355 RepID=A0A9D5R9Q7_9FIRM|nr:hypothetical protein [Ructibacterium gallinarum]MBE5041262.1 hypothetical protein [Ructibacterium gallinarum]
MDLPKHEDIDLNDLGVAGLILVQAAANLSTGNMDPLYIVEDVGNCVDADGFIRKELHLNFNGSSISFKVADECIDTPAKLNQFNNLGRGDVIQIATNSQKEIAAFTHRFDVSKWETYSPNPMEEYYGVNGGIVIFGTGTVHRAKDDFVNLSLDRTPTGENSNRVTGYFISYTRYYLVKKNLDDTISIKMVKKTNIAPGMKMMFFRYYQSFREVVLYEGF